MVIRFMSTGLVEVMTRGLWAFVVVASSFVF